MKRISITLDEETLNLLAGKINVSETIRQAVKIYIGDISPDTIEGFRVAFTKVENRLKEIESKVDYIAGKL